MATGDALPGMEVAIVVRDLETMTRFYGDVLGLPHVVDDNVDGGIMRRFACSDGIVKLLRFDEVPDGANPPGGARGGTGLRYFTVKLDALEEATKRCEEVGAKVVYPLTATGSAWFTILEDPEGNWLELTQQRA